MNKEKNITIDNIECIKCGICVTVCPAKIFIEKNNKVELVNNNFKYCVNCGDCVSVCQRNAIVKSDMSVEEDECGSFNLESNKFLCFLRNRRSIRSYRGEQLTKEETEYLLKVASLSPRGGHTDVIRNTGIIIVKDKEIIDEIIEYSYKYMKLLKKRLSSVWLTIPKKLNSSLKDNINNTIERIDYILEAKERNMNMLTYDAPNLVILHSEKGNPISRENLTILEYQMMLGAETLNLGTCFLGWSSFALQSFRVKQSDGLKEILIKLGIPHNREILSVFGIGRKLVKYKKVKKRSEIEATIL